MKIHVLFFGILAEKAGSEKIDIEAISDLADLRKYLTANYPALDNFQYQVSVNRNIITGNIELKDDDEVALMPPFAGG